VEILEHEILYRGFFRLTRYRLRHSLYRGGMSEPIVRELLVTGNAVAVLPYDPQRDEVLLIEQFRIGALNAPAGPWQLEVVAGFIEGDESADEVAQREADEEAGCVFQALEPIHSYLLSPGGSSERIELFCGRVDTRGAGGVFGVPHEGEDIRASVFSFQTAMELLAAGRVGSATPIIALQWLAANRERLRAKWS
jgi:ADP-ribose pyrophosphatase